RKIMVSMTAISYMITTLTKTNGKRSETISVMKVGMMVWESSGSTKVTGNIIRQRKMQATEMVGVVTEMVETVPGVQVQDLHQNQSRPKHLRLPCAVLHPMSGLAD